MVEKIHSKVLSSFVFVWGLIYKPFPEMLVKSKHPEFQINKETKRKRHLSLSSYLTISLSIQQIKVNQCLSNFQASFTEITFTSSICFLKFKNRNTKTMREMCSNLSRFNFEQISRIVLVFQ